MSDVPPEDWHLLPAFQPFDPIEGLTDRERRFADAYFEVSLENGDNTDSLLLAYRRAFPLAGNSDRIAIRLSAALIRERRVQELIIRLRVRLASRQASPSARVIQEVERIAFANPIDFVQVTDDGSLRIDPTRWTPAMTSAIHEITMDETIHPNSGMVKRNIKIRWYDKLSALDKLGQFHGLWRDKSSRGLSIDDLEFGIRDMERRLIERGITIDADGVQDESSSSIQSMAGSSDETSG